MNRLSIFLLIISCASAAIAEQPPADLGSRPQGEDSADFLGPQRSGRSAETGLNLDWQTRPPQVVWQCELGASYSAPTVSRGRLFHFDRYGDQHRLTCRNSETGAELWTYELPAEFKDMLGYNNGPRATPVVDGDRVYVMSPEGRLHCVTAVDGKKVWSIDTTEKFGVVKNFFGVGSTPLVWQDLLIANIGGSPPGSPPDVYAAGGKLQGNGSGVVAFDKLTGKVRWQATDELSSYASPVIAEVGAARPESGKGVAELEGDSPRPSGTQGVPPETKPRRFVFARGGLMMLDPVKGTMEAHFPWRASKLESVNASTPVVVGNEVFISEAYGPGSALVKVPPTNRASGFEVVWQDELRSRDRAMELHWNTAVHHEGFLYGSSGQHGGSAELRCIEWATGKVRWREPRLTRSSLLYVDGRLVCLSEDGSLRLLKATPEQFEQLAEFPLKDDAGEPLLTYPAWTAPVLAHGLLYVRGNDRLVCLDLHSMPNQ